jgi:hypothetical protein
MVYAARTAPRVVVVTVLVGVDGPVDGPTVDEVSVAVVLMEVDGGDWLPDVRSVVREERLKVRVPVIIRDSVKIGMQYFPRTVLA